MWVIVACLLIFYYLRIMIFYFSGTGNTFWVAKTIAQATGDCLIDLAEALRNKQFDFTLKDEERLGFCFPTHGWQPPHLVRCFINKANIRCGSDTYVYAITTCGDNMGEAMIILNRDLKKKGLHASTQFSVVMPESYVCLPFMHTDTPKREKEKIEQARQQLKHISEVVKAKLTCVVELERGATPRLYSYVIGAFFNRFMVGDKHFEVDAEACIRCGKCEKICPVDNVKGAPPTWIHNGQCTSCLACYHHCPTHAINYGKITRTRGQYFFNKRGDQK